MKRILIIEHEEPVQTLLDYTITPFEDVEVDWSFAQTVQEALESLGERAPDLVLLDVELPGLTGSGLCQRVSEAHQTKLLLLVPMGQRIQLDGCKEQATIQKNFEPNELRLLLGRLLGIRVQL